MKNIIENINNELRQNLADEKVINNVILHHYTSADALKEILKNQKIWFSNTKFLNDSSENNYIYNLFPRQYNEYEQELDLEFFSQLNSIADEYLTKDYCSINNKKFWAAEDIFVASFSLKEDNLPLWNYYCHATNCIGYNITFNPNPFKIDTHHLYKFISGKVIYDRNKQVNLLKNIILKYNDLFISNKEKLNNDSSLKETFYKSFINIIELYNIFFKDEAFHIEEEYRFAIFNLLRSYIVELKYRIKNGCFIPYIEIDFEKDKIRQIGISPTENKEFAKRGTELFLQIENYNSVNVWTSNIPQRY